MSKPERCQASVMPLSGFAVPRNDGGLARVAPAGLLAVSRRTRKLTGSAD